MADDAVVRDDTRGRRAGRVLRWLLGAFSLVGGLTWILLTPGRVNDLLVGGVFAAAGLVLLMPHRITLPRRATAVAMVVAALAGTGAGSFVAERQVCCMYAYVENRGWPIDWAQRGAVADDPATAERAAGSMNWSIDLPSLTGSLLMWAYVGMLVVVIAVLVRRRRRDQPIRS
jgi:hypothetical protein